MSRASSEPLRRSVERTHQGRSDIATKAVRIEQSASAAAGKSVVAIAMFDALTILSLLV